MNESEENGMVLGEKLKRLRKSRGLSQEQLATELNVSRQSISKWELGESKPEIENLITLSEYFNVSIDELLKINKECTSTVKVKAKEEQAAINSGCFKKGIKILIGLFLLWVMSVVLVYQLLF